MNYKYRMHDPRIGRFFAVDPLAPKYPHNSVYAFSENVVIDHVELEGLEKAKPDQTYELGGNVTASGVNYQNTTQEGEISFGTDYNGTIDGREALITLLVRGPNAGNYIGTTRNDDGNYTGTFVVGGNQASGDGFNITSTKSSPELDRIKKLNDNFVGRDIFQYQSDNEGNESSGFVLSTPVGENVNQDYTFGVYAQLGWNDNTGELNLTNFTVQSQAIGGPHALIYGGVSPLAGYVLSGGTGSALKTSAWVSRKAYQSLAPAIQKKVTSAIGNGIVSPTGRQGIIKLTSTEAAATGYTHKIKILGKGGDLRIYGNQGSNGHIYFDKIMKH